MTARRRTSTPSYDDKGLAAVEFALLATVLLTLVALVAPISYLFYERVQLGRAVGDTIRFASSRSDVARTVGSFTVAAKALPSSGAVEAEQQRSYRGRGTLTTSGPTRTTDSSCPSGRRVSITLATTVDVGPFVGLLSSGGTRTLTATATSCEE